jgi:hypothetical protein
MYKKGDLLRVSMLGDTKDAEAMEDSNNNKTRVKISYNDVLKKSPQTITISVGNELITKR